MKLYFDIDTQIDFLYPAGALYVPGAEKLIPAIASLNREAELAGHQVISTTCAHTEDDPEFKVWPHHCVIDTVGQTKPPALLLGTRQIILKKSQLDLFLSPETDPLITSLHPEECVVYGVVTEYCVKHCAMGLLDRGYKVSLVRNAIQSLSDSAAAEFLTAFTSRPGARLR